MDADGDSFGNPAFSIVSCPIVDPVTNRVAPIGYSENADDCDDLDGDLFHNVEICNGKLDDCDAAEDADGDGVVEYTARSVEIDHDMMASLNVVLSYQTGSIQQLCHWVRRLSTTDDDVSPGAPELCTGEVEDCLS